ncbi:hypothetical protein, partial [Streptomyces lavenduligriseus]
AGTSLTSWYTPKDDVQHLGYVGTDQKVHELFFFLTGGDRKWHHNAPSFVPASEGVPPNVTAGTSLTSWYTPKDNVQHLGYVGTDQKVHELFFFLTGGDRKWHHNVPSDAFGRPPNVAGGTSPTSWYTPKDDAQHLGYVGTDQKVHELFFFIV